MFICPRDVPPAAPRSVTVAPEPSVNVALALLAAIVMFGVLMFVVEPAAVVTSDVAGFWAPVLLPITNDVAAVIVLLAPRFSVPPAWTLLFPVPPRFTVATLAVKLAASDASRTPKPAVPVFDVPIDSVPVPAPIEIDPPEAMATLPLALLLLPMTSWPIEVNPPRVRVDAPLFVSVAVGPVRPPVKLKLAVPAPVKSVLFVSVSGALTLYVRPEAPASALRFTIGVTAPLLISSNPVEGAAALMLMTEPPAAAPVPCRSRRLSWNAPARSFVFVLDKPSSRTVPFAPTNVSRVATLLTGATSQPVPADHRSAALMAGV